MGKTRNQSSYEKSGITCTFWETIVKPMIFRRDNWKCKHCWKTSELEIHSKSGKHIDADDLITLCKDCHYKVHGRKRRSFNT